MGSTSRNASEELLKRLLKDHGGNLRVPVSFKIVTHKRINKKKCKKIQTRKTRLTKKTLINTINKNVTVMIFFRLINAGEIASLTDRKLRSREMKKK